MPFRNPYHFAPISDAIPHTIESPVGGALTADRLGHRTFDRYHQNTLSGRLVCCLTTVGPVVIGAQQPKGAAGYTPIQPFERGGIPAIPASTLRGCISAIAEAASNSALRVLDNTAYSHRVTMEEVRDNVADFSAIGMIVEQDGVLGLRPLTMPTLSAHQGRLELPSKYRKMFPAVRLKAFCYNSNTLENVPDAYSQENPTYYYARLSNGYVMDEDFHITGTGGKTVAYDRILLGLNTVGDPVLSPPVGQESLYTRGILRVLYVQNRRGDIPTTKHHEIFIPYPEEMENALTFPIDPEALKRFCRLASDRKTENERRAQSSTPLDPLPYALKGAQPFKDRPDPYCLRDRDIVFFVPNDTGDEVAELWVSQMWRKEIPHSAHDFFGHVNPELLPYHQGRTKITPAEAMFGFVEVNKKGETEDAARALASRIRFSEGRIIKHPDSGYYYPETPLRILASPKPPCPPFYFRKNQLPPNPERKDCHISKQELNPQKHRPQGRKFYLNHVIDSSLANRSYKTRHPEENQQQKNKVTPLREECRFVFHIDFDNLSKWELGLLIYAIQPTAEFHHKIGMAKALGLGTVKLEIAGLFYVDRRRRYSGEGFYNTRGELERRYHRCWIHQGFGNEDHREIFGKDEMEAIAGGTLSDDSHEAPDRLKAEFAGNGIEPIRKALHKIGQPGIDDIRPPLAQGQQDPEEETFKWFQNNDHAESPHRQGLVPLEYGEDAIITRLRENSSV